MVLNCVNPNCRVPFSHGRGGRIFTVDRVLANRVARACESQDEQFWLCGTCSQSLKVVVENGRITTAPIEIETATLAG